MPSVTAITVGLRPSRSGDAARVWPFDLSGIRGIKPYPGDAGSFLYELAGVLGTFASHHLSRSQREPERIGLVFKVKNDLSRHSTLPWIASFGRGRLGWKRSIELTIVFDEGGE